MINLKQIFTKEYLLYADGAKLHPTDHGLLVLGVALVVLGIIFRFVSWRSLNPFKKRVWTRLGSLALTIGLLEMLWFGLRYQNAGYLASHLVAFLILLAGLLWLIPIIKYVAKQYRADNEKWQKEQVKQKYLRNSR